MTPAIVVAERNTKNVVVRMTKSHSNIPPAPVVPRGNLPAGHFISIEGLDGCGKSTQIERLEKTLEEKGYSTLRVREPGGCVISEQIRHVLLEKKNANMALSTELMLYNAARAQLVEEVIFPALQAGKVVLADRFGWATYAYQGYGRQLPLEQIHFLGQMACNPSHTSTSTYFIWPEQSFLLDIPVSTMAERLVTGEKDRMELLDTAFFTRTMEGYKALAAANSKSFTVLDGAKSVDFLEQNIQKRVLDILRVGVST
jgi:dTMP kinase